MPIRGPPHRRERHDRGMHVPFALEVDRSAQGSLQRIDAQIAALAARQHGVVARRELVELGLGRRAIGHRIDAGRLHPIHRGVYAVGHRPRTSEAAWMAAVLVADGAVLSHRSAAALWGIRRNDRTAVEITVPRALRRRARLEIRQARLRPDEVTTHHAIPVTTPARTLLDLAAVVSPQHVERAATEAEIQRLTSPTSLADLVARYPTRSGTKAIRTLLKARDIGRNVTKDQLELRFLAFLDTHRLPRPRINSTVDVDPRPREVDCLWPDHRLIAELDGFATHGTRTAFEADRDRDRALLVAGYRVTRITWRQIAEDERALAGALRSLLDPARAPDH
jgi:predicted transcriptional regulator of viral defense system